MSFEIGIEQLGAQPMFVSANKNRLHAQKAIMAALIIRGACVTGLE